MLTMDRNIEFQQNLTTLPIAVLIVEAVSNRLKDIEPLAPSILQELSRILPESLRRIVA